MFLRVYRRSPLRRWTRIVIFFAIVGFLDLLSIQTKYKIFQQNLTSSSIEFRSELPPQIRDQKILICAQFWTSAGVLAQHWNDDLLDLIETLRVQNVYISIYESGSLDETKVILQRLDAKLGDMGVKRRIIMDPTTHQDEINKLPGINTQEEGWIHTPRSGDAKELRRIPYLARLRNKGLEPLWDGSTGMKFDKVLFLNDVDFRSGDVLTLLATRSGHYSVACALDFLRPPAFYDTFALRDSEGNSAATDVFPYFRSGESRRSILSGEPTRVQSCWNGMVVMDPEPFMPRTDSKEVLKFRGIDDTLAVKHLEGSECCLINADLSAMGAAEGGIWINPAVRVGYHNVAYNAVHNDDDGPEFLTPREYIFGIYKNRLARLWNGDWALRRLARKRIKVWKKEGVKIGETRTEPGEMCLVNEMQVLIWNGWAHL